MENYLEGPEKKLSQANLYLISLDVLFITLMETLSIPKIRCTDDENIVFLFLYWALEGYGRSDLSPLNKGGLNLLNIYQCHFALRDLRNKGVFLWSDIGC